MSHLPTDPAPGSWWATWNTSIFIQPGSVSVMLAGAPCSKGCRCPFWGGLLGFCSPPVWWTSCKAVLLVPSYPWLGWGWHRQNVFCTLLCIHPWVLSSTGIFLLVLLCSPEIAPSCSLQLIVAYVLFLVFVWRGRLALGPPSFSTLVMLLSFPSPPFFFLIFHEYTLGFCFVVAMRLT